MTPLFPFLPPTPSAFLRELCANLKTTEANPNFSISMATWWDYAPNHASTCSVCLAGSWLAAKLNWNINDEPGHLEAKRRVAELLNSNFASISYVEDKIDSLRSSNIIAYALSSLYSIQIPPPTNGFHINSSDITPLLTYASQLESLNL